MALIPSICLYQFKNHASLNLELEEGSIITGPNGVGKSNLLESVYLLVNGLVPPGRTVEQLITDTAQSGFVRAPMLLESGLSPELTVSLARNPSKIGFLIQGETTTRAKYLQKHGYRAMLFTPIEMNLLYLGPALRRDFLDEILLLSHLEFARVRRDYFAALRSRNALLKLIQDGNAAPGELDGWDTLFVKKAVSYYGYRKMLVEFLRSRVDSIAEIVHSGYRLSLVYSGKVDLDQSSDETETQIRTYLADHRQKDIIIGHTCIGPHLDDFHFAVESAGGSDRPGAGEGSNRPGTAEYLSRGENKTLLLLLKIAGAEYIENHAKTKTLLLLDDIASELDAEHFLHFVHALGNRPFFLTGHRIPEGYFGNRALTTIELGKR